MITMILAATMCVACMDAHIDEVTNAKSSVKHIYATIVAPEEDGTRVELNDKLQTTWTEDDEIVVFNNGLAQFWQFDGNTGDRSGSFAYELDINPADENINFDRYYALVYHENMYYPSYYGDFSPAFFIHMPHVQNYKQNSYGLNTNVMLGTSDDGTNYEFKNLFGYLRLGITGDKSVKEINIKGHNGEYLTGYIVANKDAQLTQWYSEITYDVILDCGDGVQLTDEPTYFYIVMPTSTFNLGLTATITFTDGTVFPKSTSKSISFYRNTIQPMATFDTSSDIEWQTVTLTHTGDSIMAPYIGGSTSISGFIYWGDGYMSDITYEGSYVYDDGADTHTVTIKALDATWFTVDSCEGISEIDFSQF